MPLKVTGALLLVAAGAGGGWLYARRMTVRQSFLSAFLTFLSNLSTAVRYRSERIDSLIDSSGELFSFSEKDADLPFERRWQTQIRGFPQKWKLTARDMTLLREFGARLGATDTQGQLEHIALYRALFQKQLDEAAQNTAQKAKLYKTLGLFCGVSAALLIW